MSPRINNPTRPLEEKDVVRILSGPKVTKTGVVYRIKNDSNLVCVILKGNYIGTWFNTQEVVRIGRVPW